MKYIFLTAAVSALISCGPTTSGPGEISGFGLTYDQRNGGVFVGLPRTQANQMPTGRFALTGPSSALADDGSLVFADATLQVDIAKHTVNYTAQYSFPTGAPVGIVAVNLDAPLTGPSFNNTAGEDHLIGDFYGTTGAVAAGTYFVTIKGGNGENSYVNGGFIVGPTR